MSDADPPFYCPIQSRIHPDVPEIEKAALAWVDERGFCRTAAERSAVAALRAADFYGRFAPDADPEGLFIAACWIYWGFAFDDAFCDRGDLSVDPASFAFRAGQTQRAFETPGTASFADPFTAAIHDLGERMRAYATPVQVRRFADRQLEWLSGVQWEIGNRARGHIPDLDEYLTIRLRSSGGPPTYGLLEIANRSELAAAGIDAPAVRALSELAIMVAALDNDRHSYAKEMAHQDDDHNLFTVLKTHHGMTAEQALHAGVALRDRMMSRFLRLRAQVEPDAIGPLRRYLDDLGHGIRGNTEWGMRAMRYLSSTGVPADRWANGDPAQIRWADRPSDARTDAPGIPAITWWWDDDLKLPSQRVVAGAPAVSLLEARR